MLLFFFFVCGKLFLIMRDGIGPVMARKIKHHLIEFFLVGLLMGIAEDLLAIHFATDAKITPHVVWVAFLVALPFAVISELLVDFGVFHQYFRAKKHDYFNSQEKLEKNETDSTIKKKTL